MSTEQLSSFPLRSGIFGWRIMQWLKRCECYYPILKIFFCCYYVTNHSIYWNISQCSNLSGKVITRFYEVISYSNTSLLKYLYSLIHTLGNVTVGYGSCVATDACKYSTGNTIIGSSRYEKITNQRLMLPYQNLSLNLYFLYQFNSVVQVDFLALDHLVSSRECIRPFWIGVLVENTPSHDDLRICQL